MAFAVFTIFAGFCMGAMVQSNAPITMSQAGLPGIAPGTIALVVFTSVYGAAYYVVKAVEYLWGSRAILPFRWIWIAVVFVGANLSAKAVGDFADIANGLMAVPNLIALFALHGVIAAQTKRNISSRPDR